MAPLIPNGVYKIRNAQFTNQVADLSYGIPTGRIVGFRAELHNRNQEWRIENHGGGGNQVFIKNIAGGSYANADEFVGAQLFGSPDDPTLWTIVKLDAGKYYIQSPDGQLVWALPSAVDGAPIELSEFTGEDKTKWTFQRVRRQ